jgi:hypothetical protein
MGLSDSERTPALPLSGLKPLKTLGAAIEVGFSDSMLAAEQQAGKTQACFTYAAELG